MADNQSLNQRLVALKNLRAELETLRKEAFMAAPPMPGGGAPPMDPNMMPPGGGGMMPPGAPMDPAMMQGGGMMPPGAPMDPNMMPPGAPMDPNMMPPGGDPAAQGGGMTPEMMDELLGVIEGLAAQSEETEAKMEQMGQALQESMAKTEELEQRLAELAAAPAPAPAAEWQG